MWLDDNRNQYWVFFWDLKRFRLKRCSKIRFFIDAKSRSGLLINGDVGVYTIVLLVHEFAAKLFVSLCVCAVLLKQLLHEVVGVTELVHKY